MIRRLRFLSLVFLFIVAVGVAEIHLMTEPKISPTDDYTDGEDIGVEFKKK